MGRRCCQMQSQILIQMKKTSQNRKSISPNYYNANSVRQLINSEGGSDLEDEKSEPFQILWVIPNSICPRWGAKIVNKHTPIHSSLDLARVYSSIERFTVEKNFTIHSDTIKWKRLVHLSQKVIWTSFMQWPMVLLANTLTFIGC